MARTNKYASINFNHIYERNINTESSKNNPINNHRNTTVSSSSSPSNSSNLYKDHFPSNRTHGGRMLVLTRPTPKPISTISTPPLSPSPQTLSTHQQPQAPPRDQSDQISLRPLGRTGAGSSVSSPILGQDKQKEVETVVGSPKPDKFVPPHLRPGFVGKEERPGPVHRRQQQQQPQQQQGYFGSLDLYGENGPPKSGGYDGMRRGDQSDLGLMNRPGSSGNRPSSSGCAKKGEARSCLKDCQSMELLAR